MAQGKLAYSLWFIEIKKYFLNELWKHAARWRIILTNVYLFTFSWLFLETLAVESYVYPDVV